MHNQWWSSPSDDPVKSRSYISFNPQRLCLHVWLFSNFLESQVSSLLFSGFFSSCFDVGILFVVFNPPPHLPKGWRDYYYFFLTYLFLGLLVSELHGWGPYMMIWGSWQCGEYTCCPRCRKKPLSLTLTMTEGMWPNQPAHPPSSEGHWAWAQPCWAVLSFLPFGGPEFSPSQALPRICRLRTPSLRLCSVPAHGANPHHRSLMHTFPPLLATGLALQSLCSGHRHNELGAEASVYGSKLPFSRTGSTQYQHQN